MMNIIKKFKIDNFTYLFILLYFLCGYIKNIVVIYLIVFIHELGHVVIAKICGNDIKSVTFYPFGGITKIDTFLNNSLRNDLIVYLGGLIFQFLLYGIMLILYDNHLISFNFYNMFISYNKFIFLFNLIPIVPLDGYLILNILFNSFVSYYKSLILSFIVSSVSLLVFIYFYKNNYVIIIFLFLNTINYFKNIKSLYNRFVLERYLYDFSYRKIKYFRNFDLKNMTKECLCYFKGENLCLSEKQLLNKRFDNITRIW